MAKFRHTAVVADEERSAHFLVVALVLRLGEVSFLDALVVVREDAGNVQAEGAGHAILARGAGDVFQVIDFLGDVFEEVKLFICKRFHRTVGGEVVVEVVHVGHAAEGGEHVGEGAAEAERPRRHAALRLAFLHLPDDVVGHVGEAAA